ncbi:hypothetical protein MN608_01733 [Microdochium nivale]|nr:hypothetical protein MN608_01733 [Microdochium nivale]
MTREISKSRKKKKEGKKKKEKKRAWPRKIPWRHPVQKFIKVADGERVNSPGAAKSHNVSPVRPPLTWVKQSSPPFRKHEGSNNITQRGSTRGGSCGCLCLWF